MAPVIGLWQLYRSSPLPRIQVLAGESIERRREALQSVKDADILVVAGRLGDIETSIELIAKTDLPTVLVLGPEDMRGRDFSTVAADANTLARGTKVHVLEKGQVVIDGVRFLGATLWNSFSDWRQSIVREAMFGNRQLDAINADSWLRGQESHELIDALCLTADIPLPGPSGNGSRVPMHPAIAYIENRRTMQWLEQALSEPFMGPTVVVSHNSPTRAPLYTGDGKSHYRTANASSRVHQYDKLSRTLFSEPNDLDDFLRRHVKCLDLWVHGGAGANSDLVQSAVRVLCRNGHVATSDDGKEWGEFVDWSRFGQRRKKKKQSDVPDEPLPIREIYHPAPIELERGLTVPLAAEMSVVAAELREHEAAIRDIVKHSMTSSSVLRACVRRVIREECEEAAELCTLIQRLHLQTTDFNGIQVRLGSSFELRVPNGYPEKSNEIGREDYYATLERLTKQIELAQALPFAATRKLAHWCGRTDALLRVVGSTACPLYAVRPSLEALRVSRETEYVVVVVPSGDVDREELRKILVDAQAEMEGAPLQISVRTADQIAASGQRTIAPDQLRAIVESLAVARIAEL
jgi:hypothetical protein